MQLQVVNLKLSGIALQDTGLPVDWAFSADSNDSACRCCLALAQAWRLPFRTLPLLSTEYMSHLIQQ